MEALGCVFHLYTEKVKSGPESNPKDLGPLNQLAIVVNTGPAQE